MYYFLHYVMRVINEENQILHIIIYIIFLFIQDYNTEFCNWIGACMILMNLFIVSKNILFQNSDIIHFLY